MSDDPQPGADGPDASVENRRARRAALLHAPPPASSGPAWVLTFADLTSQLIGLLILILTFASFEPARFQRLSGAVRQVFGREVSNEGSADLSTTAGDPEKQAAAARRAGVLDGLRGVAARHGGRLAGGQVDVEVFESYRGVTLRLAQEAMFDPLEEAVRPAAWPFLDEMGDLAVARRCPLEIELRVQGTAERALDPAAASQLAGRRGVSVVRYLLGRDAGLREDAVTVRAVGVPEEAAPVPTAAGRVRADRVDFLLVAPADLAPEP